MQIHSTTTQGAFVQLFMCLIQNLCVVPRSEHKPGFHKSVWIVLILWSNLKDSEYNENEPILERPQFYPGN